MNITRSNYEEFVLDYLEGTLSEELRLAMQQFLQQNADLKQELSEFSAIIINPDETIQLPNKANLLCDLIALDNYEEYAIDYIEQNLSPETQLAMNLFLETEPLLKNELNNFTLVTASADESVIYEHKEQLKKRAGKTGLVVLFFANPVLRYAAAVAALLVLWQPISNMFDNHEMITALPHLKNNSIASNKSTTASPLSLPNKVSANNNNSTSVYNTALLDKGTNKAQNNQLTKPIKIANSAKTVDLTSKAALNVPNEVVEQVQTISAQNMLAIKQTSTLRAATPTQLASLDAKNVVDNTVINYIITPKKLPLDADVKPKLLKRLGNRSNNAETMFAQNVLSRLPNSLLPQTLSEGLNSRRQSVSVEVPIQPEAHQRLKNFLGNK